MHNKYTHKEGIVYLNQYHIMIETEEYKNNVNMSKGKDRNKQFQELNSKYGLTEYSLHEYVKPMQHHFKENIDSNYSTENCHKMF